MQSVWSQTARHDWVTEQHQSKNTRNVRPAHCSLYLLCSQKKERKKNSFLFLFLFNSTPTPRGSPTFPGSWAQTPRVVLQWLSTPLPEPLASKFPSTATALARAWSLHQDLLNSLPQWCISHPISVWSFWSVNQTVTLSHLMPHRFSYAP